MKATVTQLAAYVGKSERTVHRWLASGKYPHSRLPGGLIEIDDSLLVGPENEHENALLATLTRIEQKLDALSAQVGTLTAQPPTSHVQPHRATPARSDEVIYLTPELVAWRKFARLHGIAETTVDKAIKSGRLPTVAGEWHIGRTIYREGLDAAGRHAFYEQYHTNERFTPCPDCPHE